MQAAHPIPTLICIFCGEPFVPKRRGQRYCRPSHRVRDAVRRFYSKNKRNYHVRPKFALSGRCKICKKPVIFKTKNARYCGKECRMIANKLARKA
jgi:hypothetical protein